MTAFRIMMAGITALIKIVLGESFRRLSKREWIYTLLGMLFVWDKLTGSVVKYKTHRNYLNRL